MNFAGFHAQRRCKIGELRRHPCLVDVDADSDHRVVHAVGFGVHLSEDAGELPSAHEQIIWPANVGKNIKLFGRGIPRGEARH